MLVNNEAPVTDAAERAGTLMTGGILRYVLAVLYGFALCYAYEVLSRWWAYFGFTYQLSDDTLRYLSCFIAAAPAVLLVSRPRTFAEASAWFLYALVFLPCMLVPVMQYSSDASRLIRVSGATLFGCVIFLILVRGDVRRISPPKISPQFFWSVLVCVWLGLLALILISFGGQLQFVGADDIYTQRFAGADVASNPVVRYAIAILASAIDPFLIAAGLHSRRYFISAAGTITQIVLFGTLAARAVLLSPFIVVGAYLLSDGNSKMRGNFLLFGLVALFIMTSPLLFNYNPVGGGVNQVTTLIYLRTLLISGATYGVYEQFFSLFPLTYFSNNNLIGIFIDYPYGTLSVGQAVLSFLVPISGTDIPELNANFLATDGMAALGLIGVPLASIFAALVLRVMSWFVPRQRTMLMVAGGTGFILSLANTSVLTSLVTGGGVLFTVLVFVAPIDRD